MDVSNLTVRVILLFFPGVLCAILVDALTVHRGRSAVEFLIRAFVLGIGSYLLFDVLFELWKALIGVFGYVPSARINFFRALVDEKEPVQWGEILCAAAVAVLLAGAVAGTLNHKLVHRVAHRLNLSRKIGDLDVWSFLWNSPVVSWAYVRDAASDVVYQGRVRAFSETADDSQLLLEEVKVFRNSTGSELYTVPVVYLAFPKNGVTIEVWPDTVAG